jgi:hypothetical protein
VQLTYGFYTAYNHFVLIHTEICYDFNWEIDAFVLQATILRSCKICTTCALLRESHDSCSMIATHDNIMIYSQSIF